MKENTTVSLIEHIKILSINKKDEKKILLDKRDNKGIKKNINMQNEDKK